MKQYHLALVLSVLGVTLLLAVDNLPMRLIALAILGIGVAIGIDG